jgi:hypothetical protein
LPRFAGCQLPIWNSSALHDDFQSYKLCGTTRKKGVGRTIRVRPRSRGSWHR